jgi:hypothetical protein
MIRMPDLHHKRVIPTGVLRFVPAFRSCGTSARGAEESLPDFRNLSGEK